MAGGYRQAAAASAGVSKSVFFEWMKEDKEFAERVKRAERDAEQALVAQIRAHATTTWTAGAWLLERRRPDRWGKRDFAKTEVRLSTSTEGLGSLPREQRIELLRELLRKEEDTDEEGGSEPADPH